MISLRGESGVFIMLGRLLNFTIYNNTIIKIETSTHLLWSMSINLTFAVSAAICKSQIEQFTNTSFVFSSFFEFVPNSFCEKKRRVPNSFRKKIEQRLELGIIMHVLIRLLLCFIYLQVIVWPGFGVWMFIWGKIDEIILRQFWRCLAQKS